MNCEKNILIAFVLNLFFSIVEFIGGFFTNSIAIISDAVHDFSDSISIGLSLFLERKSKKSPDDKYTYGYSRYSVLAAFISSLILLVSSSLIIYNAIVRLFNPAEVNHDGMFWLAIFGLIINLSAAYVTWKGQSLNQKAVNIHMLEDVLTWAVVLIGAVVMKFTDISILDPLLSLVINIFLLMHVIKNIKEQLNVFLEKIPSGISVSKVTEEIMRNDKVLDVHHVHIWSLDGINIHATFHVVAKKYSNINKSSIRSNLEKLGISHVTMEIETEKESCENEICVVQIHNHERHHH